LAIAVTTGVLPVAGPQTPAVADEPPTAPLGPFPPEGALFGAAVAVGERNGPSQWLANQGFEELIGRGMALERAYFGWDEAWPGANEYLARDLGRTLILSWSSRRQDGEVVPWARIAEGQEDALIDARARDLKSFGAPLFFAFHHEPNNKWNAGTPDEYIAAWRHVRNRFEQQGVTNVSYTLIMFDTAYEPDGKADDYYPGDAHVDVLGVDAFNWNGCPGRNDPWRSFEDKVAPFYEFGLARDKPMVIAELGSNEDPIIPFRKAQWFLEASTTLKLWPEIKGVSYMHNGEPNTCNWYVDSSSLALLAFQTWGADPYFNPDLPPPPPTNTSTYVSVFDEGFSVPNGFPEQGRDVTWLFQGRSAHTVTDSSGLELFDSGRKSAGASWSFTFDGAANYSYACTIHPELTAEINVPIVATPPEGGLGTRFTVTWSAERPPSGYVFDVEIRRPGSDHWEPWLEGVTSTKANFEADSGRGTYGFRSRLENPRLDAATNWSRGAVVTVS
jgi:hypothetical protein